MSFWSFVDQVVDGVTELVAPSEEEQKTSTSSTGELEEEEPTTQKIKLFFDSISEKVGQGAEFAGDSFATLANSEIFKRAQKRAQDTFDSGVAYLEKIVAPEETTPMAVDGVTFEASLVALPETLSQLKDIQEWAGSRKVLSGPLFDIFDPSKPAKEADVNEIAATIVSLSTAHVAWVNEHCIESIELIKGEEGAEAAPAGIILSTAGASVEEVRINFCKGIAMVFSAGIKSLFEICAKGEFDLDTAVAARAVHGIVQAQIRRMQGEFRESVNKIGSEALSLLSEADGLELKELLDNVVADVNLEAIIALSRLQELLPQLCSVFATEEPPKEEEEHEQGAVEEEKEEEEEQEQGAVEEEKEEDA